MAELRAAYLGRFVRAADRTGKEYEDNRGKLVGTEGYLLIYREFHGETLRFIPEESTDEFLQVPHGTKTMPLGTDTLEFETESSLYVFEHVRRIR